MEKDIKLNLQNLKPIFFSLLGFKRHGHEKHGLHTLRDNPDASFQESTRPAHHLRDGQLGFTHNGEIILFHNIST